MSQEHVFPFSKINYIRGEKFKGCILCSIVKDDGQLPSLKIASSKNILICVNLYPYNSGHIMIFPKRHITDLRDLNFEEEKEITLLTKFFISIIEKLYNPAGFNIGYNLGNYSGASINHIHRHIIPRFENELGIIDLIGGSKVIIEDPNKTMQRMRDEVSANCKELQEIDLTAEI